MTEMVRLIAFFLPQFHPIPENDQWWGKGFTEWRSVVQARPLFRGHYQPHLPADLGFYDLRLAEVMEAQAELASRYGIHGFCYYHYWFNGRRLLGRPVDELLASSRPNFPFCLCWANEDWTRAWDGRSGDPLIRQKYSPEDDRRHLQWLARAFRDERYIRIDGKPLFLVYRARLLPDPLRTTEIWREEAHRLGIGELFLARVESFGDEGGDPAPLGFDAAVEFQPDWKRLGRPLRRGRLWDALRALGLSSRAFGQHRIYDYGTVVQRMLESPLPPYARFSCVTPSWDNTPRRKADGVVLNDSSPRLYARWLGAAVGEALSGASEKALVFINAWNEWGEGNHLEPSQRWGRAYLEATWEALAAAGAGDRRSVDGPPVTAVVLTYRRPRQASQVARELLDTERLDPGQILVVVNGDGGLESPALEAKVTVLRLAENLGPAGGFAHALGFVRDNSTVPWIYLCEDDQGRHSLPVPRLSGLIESVERFEREVPGPPVGVVLASGRHIDMRTGRTYPHEFRSSDAGFEEVDFGPFWGAILSSRVVDAGVFPDEAMFWGGEDLDFWLQVRAAGFRILVDPVAHKAAGNKASSGEPWCGYYVARNGFLLRRRYGDPRWTMWHLLKSVRRFQLAPSREHRVAIARGLVDGMYGRTGRNAEFSR